MDIFLMIALTHFIALLSPGPDFFLLLTSLLSNGRRAATWVCIGIALGNALILILVYSCMLMLGKLDANILHYVQYLGAGYLLYLAIRCFNAARQPFVVTISAETRSTLFNSSLKYLGLGLQSSLLNPKNILFYSSLIVLVYSQFSVWQHVLICIWMLAVVLAWNLGLLKLLSRAAWIDWLKCQAAYLYYLSAACFLVFALLGFLLKV